MPVGWLLLAVPIALFVGVASVAAWRRPALGLGIFAVGLAFHNAAIMILLNAGTPSLMVRGLQAWKELVIVVLLLRVGSDAWHDRSGGIARLRSSIKAGPWPVRVLDGVAIAFTVLLLVYLLASFVSVFGTTTSVAQRLLSFRIFILIPLLYALGRIFGIREGGGLRISVYLVVTAAVSVAVIGFVELWFLPTRLWVDLGVNQFTAWQGFVYLGPGGLPENFFQSTNEGYGLRRMVSTYISPLGIAYTALLVVPLIVGLLLTMRRVAGWTWFAFALVLTSIALSVTRLALLCLLLEAVLWVVVTQRRLAVVTGVLSLAAFGVAFSIYPRIGPIVTFDLVDVRPPAGAALIGAISRDAPGGDNGSLQPTRAVDPDLIGHIVNQEDASIQAHILAVRDGFTFVIQNPLGTGLGSTTPRFGTPTGPGESAFLGIAGEVGMLGGAMFAALYGGVALVGLVGARRLKEPASVGLSLLVGIGAIGLAPVVLSSAVWGDFSVTFMFWWAAGAIVSAVGGLVRTPEDGRPATPASGPAWEPSGEERADGSR